MDQGDSTQKPNSPVLCSNGCGFFGNPLTLNMCSKCYRDTQARLQQQQPPNNNNNDNNNSRLIPAIPDNIIEQGSAPAGLVVQAAAEEQDKREERKVQSDTTRCFSCQKKVGLLGFKCRCDYVFCAMHRYSDKHECSFDYKSMNKAALQKANPVVQAKKLDKI